MNRLYFHIRLNTRRASLCVRCYCVKGPVLLGGRLIIYIIVTCQRLHGNQEFVGKGSWAYQLSSVEGLSSLLKGWEVTGPPCREMFGKKFLLGKVP